MVQDLTERPRRWQCRRQAPASEPLAGPPGTVGSSTTVLEAVAPGIKRRLPKNGHLHTGVKDDQRGDGERGVAEQASPTKHTGGRAGKGSTREAQIIVVYGGANL